MQDVLLTVFILGYKTIYNSILSGNLSSIYILFTPTAYYRETREVFQPKRKELTGQWRKLHK
jgi:hypothetical protein